MTLILVRPHTSLLDGPAVALYLGKIGMRNAVFAVDPDYARHPIWKRILNAYGWITGRHTMLPLDATHPFALRALDRLLQEGRNVVIFPQGTGIGDPDRPDAKGVDWLIKHQGRGGRHLLTYRPMVLTLSHNSTWPHVAQSTPESWILRRALA